MEENKDHNLKEFFIEKGYNALNDNYQILKRLGKGSFGNVYLVRQKSTGEYKACKKISKLVLQDELKYKKEIEILIKADHPNILKLYGIYETVRSIYLITEECKGGTLLERILENVNKKKDYSEKQACDLFSQIMSGIAYLHSNGICHRDIKLENILYLYPKETNDNTLKLIDFGFGNFFQKGNRLQTKLGSAYYIAPEVLEGNYNEKCDVWSAGVILFFLLCGRLPFYGNSEEEIYSNIKKMSYQIPLEKINKISDDAKDLISHMLISEDKRYSSEEVLSHRWFKNSKNISLAKLDFDSSFLLSYKDRDIFQKITLTCIASKLNTQQIQDLVNIFKGFDINHDGNISFKEFEQGLLQLNQNNLTEKDIKDIFNAIDIDHNGSIAYTEFLAVCVKKTKYLKQEKIYEAFSVFDKENTGFINKEDIISVLQNEMKGENIEKIVDDIIKNLDENKDGKISYKEFCSFLE